VLQAPQQPPRQYYDTNMARREKDLALLKPRDAEAEQMEAKIDQTSRRPRIEG
jgi:hypothetical protein